jgi:hypothetical protein
MTGAGGGSVWQQALGAWREAGLEWQRPGGWQPADADLQRTEPIPVVSATATAADVGLVPSPAGQPAGPSPGSGGQGVGVAEREAGRDGGQHPGPHPQPGWQHPRRSTRGMLVGAGVCVALLAVAVAGIVITGPLNAGPNRGLPGLVVAYPPARLADGQFAGLGGSPGKQVPPSLTGVAAADSTVVAVGSRATLPSARPLVLMSPDGGRTWQPALLRAQAGGAAAGPGAVPLMVAGGLGRWLAVGPDATWLSSDGWSWRLGPGIAPLAAGDRVRALARTSGGFVAVGENVRLLGAHVARTPVLWISTNGLTWQRRGPSQLGLPAGKGRVLALRWVAARGGVLMIAGEVARTVVEHRGKRKLRVLKEFPAVWRSHDDAAHWLRADPPASHGATTRLAGLAATSSGVVAIRPGRSASGVRDAVAYIWVRGPSWRFAGKLRARRGAALNVTSVAGSDHGAVAAGSAGRYQVAFVSVHGWSWHQTADLGRSSSAAVTGVTVGPGGKVVAAGARAPRPFLLLAGGHRLPVGQAALAGAATSGLSVNGLGVGPGGQVAVGHADGAPAVWSRPAGGRWARMAATTPPSWHGTGPGLTSVVRGAAGWLAVGSEGGQAGTAVQVGAAGTLDSATASGGQQPVLMTSPDGRIWHPAAGAGSLAGPGLTLTGAAAGPSGYVVAGVRDIHGQPGAALWWSADLTTWTPQGWWTGSAPDGAPSALLAVAAGRAVFAAVGAIGAHPAVWLSRDGRSWLSQPLALPAGASSAVLQRVAIQGRRIAALGTWAGPSGPAPFGAVSDAGGSTWRETAVPVPARPAGVTRAAGVPARPAGVTSPASVTALVAAGGGFLATGTWGASGAQDVVVWWSRDGRAWHAVRPTGTWLSGPGARQITGLSVSGKLLTGVGYVVTGTGQHPVLWQARVR